MSKNPIAGGNRALGIKISEVFYTSKISRNPSKTQHDQPDFAAQFPILVNGLLIRQRATDWICNMRQLQIALLMRAQGLTEARAHALATLIWGTLQ